MGIADIFETYQRMSAYIHLFFLFPPTFTSHLVVSLEDFPSFFNFILSLFLPPLGFFFHPFPFHLIMAQYTEIGSCFSFQRLVSVLSKLFPDAIILRDRHLLLPVRCVLYLDAYPGHWEYTI